MLLAVPLAWLQLRKEPLRLVVAVSGVTFAVVLIFVQLGFEQALFDSAVRYHTNLGYDVAIISPKTDFIVRPMSFPRSRLHQARGFPGVARVSPIYLGLSSWRNPASPAETRTIFVVGFDPEQAPFDLPGVRRHQAELRLPDRVLYDRDSRPEFGPVAALFEREGRVSTEVGTRQVEVVGLFRLGTSFGIDASLITSDLNFLRLFPTRSAGQIDLGLVHLEPGADPAAARDAIADGIPRDVDVLTRDDFVEREVRYWSGATPIGYVFSFGVLMGLVVGAIIVYQILFADVQQHLQEYATLKAIGYTNRYLFGVVLQEAFILALLGYVPGFLLCVFIYAQAGAATRLPLVMTPERAGLVAALTIGMCCFSGAIALRKVRRVDPAEVF
jgi:putative ABC transport system permease protein